MGKSVVIVVAVLAAACGWLGAGAQPAQEKATTAADLQGLWVGTVSHRQETSPFCLDVEPGSDGTALVKASVPAIHLHQVPLGTLPLAITGDHVQLGEFALSLDRATGTLRGKLPDSLAPVYQLELTLRRGQACEPPERRRPAARTVTPVWTYDAGSPMWAGTSVAGDLVLAGADDGRLHALDARTGEKRWVFLAGGAIRARASVVDGVVLFQADDGVLYALSTTTGKELWRARVLDQPVVRKPSSRFDRFASDVAFATGHLFLGTHDGRVLCLDARTGARLWEYESGDAVLAAPAVAGGRVYFGSFDGHVYALDAATGELRWKHDTGKPVVSTPALAGDLLIVGSRSYDLLALNAATGAVAWQRYFWFSWVESSPAVRDGVAYVGSSDAAVVSAFDAVSGRRLWQTDVWGWTWGQPAVTATRVFVCTAGKRDYPASNRGGVMALDRTTGQAVWQFTVEPHDDATYGFVGSPAASDTLVFAAGLDGRVYAFSQEPEPASASSP